MMAVWILKPVCTEFNKNDGTHNLCLILLRGTWDKSRQLVLEEYYMIALSFQT